MQFVWEINFQVFSVLKVLLCSLPELPFAATARADYRGDEQDPRATLNGQNLEVTWLQEPVSCIVKRGDLGRPPQATPMPVQVLSRLSCTFQVFQPLMCHELPLSVMSSMRRSRSTSRWCHHPGPELHLSDYTSFVSEKETQKVPASDQ